MYILTQDPTADDGCRVVDDLFVACAPAAFHSLNGRRSTVIGFPTVRYTKRLALESVIQSRGDVNFDRDTNRILIHASISPGSSGGPTYLSRGEVIGGLKLDRPLYLGPVTNVNRSRRIKNAFATDTLVVVGVYDLNHVRELLGSAP
jgi:hypothetical protein